ncbi:MAG: hypothetical protein ABJC04_08180, partial [Verrucomicrobiota bacterium]
MNKKKFIWAILIAALLALLVFNPFSRMMLGMFFGMGHIRSIEAKLQSPEVYQPVARRLALYCQSDQSFLPDYLSSSWFPDELQK